MGALASGIGHDFNNMLTSIIGYAEIAKSEPEKQDVDFAIARVLDASYRAQRLTQQIRAVGGQHKDTGQDERIDLKEEIEELLLSIEPTVPEQIQIVKSFDSTRTYPIKADPIKIYQVLLNLSTNALQSMENTSGTLEFCLLPKNRNGEPGFVLSIEDQGSGMSEAVQQQIFEPYFSTRKGHGGTGLGLAICYSLIQSYQGAIDVDSKSGRGTRFDIWLPEAKLDETNQAPGMSKDSPPHKFNRARILVVEDETSVRNLIKHQLSKLGYQISAYASAQEALTDMSKAQLTFDLVVSDFDLGDSTGVALANELNALKLPLPMLIVTATPEKVDDAIASGLIFDVLSKPIAFSELRASIERALSHEKEQRSANFAGKSVA